MAACEFGRTASSFPEIVELDNRREESFYLEATKPAEGHDPGVHAYDPPVAQSSIEVLEVSKDAAAREHVRGDFRALPEGGRLVVQGWLLGKGSRATEVEIVVGETTVGRAPIHAKRPDIVVLFPDSADAATSGFRLVLEPDGEGESELLVRAILENGTYVPIGTVRTKTGTSRRHA